MGTSVENRTIFAISGGDRVKFLQGLVTNEVPTTPEQLVYAALLTPQGKYLADFFMLAKDRRILIDVASSFADGLMARLSMYKLRADVEIEATEFRVECGLHDAPKGALLDPRHSALGWRFYGGSGTVASDVDWDAIHVAHCIPSTGVELLANDTFILEAGFERLNGVDFKKGCYVGQEVTARMKHKTELKKGLAVVSISEPAPIGSEILNDGRLAGVLFTQSGNKAIAYLRYARAGSDMLAGGAGVSFEKSKPC